MSLPKISIVTPSFNQGKFIEETIQSVLCQDYPNLEYVIIDGGSTDNSVKIINKYKNSLHYWVSEKDEGHGHALNKGFQHTSGEIMAWINSDDKYTPWCFKVVAEIFKQFPHVMWIVGFYSWWNCNGEMIKAKGVQKNIFDFLLGRYTWIQQESVFWRRDLWEKTGEHINQGYRFMVDGELWTRFFLYESLYSVDCVFSGYRIHSENRARCNMGECLQEMEKAISAMKQNCSPQVIETSKKLKRLQKIFNNSIGNIILLSRFGRILNYPSILKNATYKNITWKNEMWVEQTLPFSL